MPWLVFQGSCSAIHGRRLPCESVFANYRNGFLFLGFLPIAIVVLPVDLLPAASGGCHAKYVNTSGAAVLDPAASLLVPLNPGRRIRPAAAAPLGVAAAAAVIAVDAAANDRHSSGVP